MGLNLISFPTIIQKQAAAPTINSNSVLWRDTDDDKLYFSDGTSWNDMAASSGGIKQISVAATINTSQTGYGTNEASEEFTAISAADLAGANYVICEITGFAKVSGPRGNSYVQHKVQTKEIGGVYADSTGYQNKILSGPINSVDDDLTSGDTWKWVHTLTAGEKTNGIQVKFFANSYVDNNGSGSPGQTSEFTNKQIILSLAP